MRTKINVNCSQEVEHRAGNFYTCFDNLYILVFPSRDEAVLICLDSGGRFTDPINVGMSTELTQDQFDTLCGSSAGEFQLVSEVNISY